MKLTASGIMDSTRFYGFNFKLERFKFYTKPQYAQELKPFGLDLVVLQFAFLIGGMCLATIVFCVEKRKRNKMAF